MPNTSQITPTVVSCFGGLVLNKDVFSMRPGEALQLTNFEPDIAGGYKKMLGTTQYNSNIVPQVSSSSEIIDMVAIFNDIVLAASCLLYTSPSPRDLSTSRMPSSA